MEDGYEHSYDHYCCLFHARFSNCPPEHRPLLRQEVARYGDDYEALTREERKRFQARRAYFAQKAPNRGKAWTGPEMEIAMRNDLTTIQKAKMLGRSTAAIYAIRDRIRREPRDDTLWGVGPGLGITWGA